MSRPVLHAIVERMCSGGTDLSELRAHLTELKESNAMIAERCMTPMMVAAMHGRSDVLDELISAGASVNFCGRADKASGNMLDTMNWWFNGDDRASPLYMSAAKGHLDCVARLIEANADVNLANTRDGSTPLYVACDQGQHECVERLLAAGAVVDAVRSEDGRTPLAAASALGHQECARLLCALGADVDHADISGETPMSLAYALLQSRPAEQRREACLAMLGAAVPRARVTAMQVRVGTMHAHSATAKPLARATVLLHPFPTRVLCPAVGESGGG